jgi:hypothetical protein
MVCEVVLDFKKYTVFYFVNFFTEISCHSNVILLVTLTGGGGGVGGE